MLRSAAFAVGLIALAGTASAADMRRLTEAEYRHTIADLFGGDIKIAGRFEPDLRRDGLLAVGTSEVAVTRAGFELYDNLARSIAAQVLDETHRATSVPCKPADAKAPDDACAAQFISATGRKVLRQPLSDKKVTALVAIANKESQTARNFYSGLQYVLAGLLVSPEFLFRVEAADPFAKATRLSYFLWNTTPDEALLTAAEKGELDSKSGLTRQVERMLASPRFETGVRSFFSDMLGFDAIESVAKDPSLFPRFSRLVMNDAEEQTLRTITSHLIAEKGDYRDLFTTRRTFMTRALGTVYRVPVAAETGWEQHDFAPDDPRAGLLTQVSFLSLHGPSGRTSPTLRGKAVREVFLCQKVPDPPAAVTFALVEDTKNTTLKTVRDRLTAHRTDAVCAGCHKIMDPVGLALENFDGLGQFRADENGAPIDASGVVDGKEFTDAASLGRVLHASPALSSCLVGNTLRYATGRTPKGADREWLNSLEKSFAKDGYRVPALWRRIATHDAFYATIGAAD